MASESCSSSNEFEPINQFALVSYIQDPLGGFLDALRLQLEPDCKPHAHVTILPPRPLCTSPEKAIRQIKQLARNFRPFSIRMGDVAKFEGSDVIYIKLSSGSPEMRSMYEALNSGGCEYCERYSYCPHITLAQNLTPDRVEETFEAATAAWNKWRLDRSFRVETLSFVQNTVEGRWIDLQQITLREPSMTPRVTQSLTQKDLVEPVRQV